MMEGPEDTEVRRTLKAHVEYFVAPADLRAQIVSSVRGSSASTRRPSRSFSEQLRDWFALPIPRLAAGFAAGVLVTLLGARFFAASAADDATVVALLSDHTRALMADSTIEVASSNSHTVKPWLSAKLGYSPDVVDLSQEGYPLIGGRRGYLGSTPVAVMAYAYKEHEIDLYALTAESATRVGARLAGRDGYNVRSWSRGGMRYIAVSDVAGDRLDEFVSRIQAHQDHTSD
ncbi:MAG: hypothetical protein ABSF50_05060 [Burkholderiaceae bacterium]|jgi:anti-sigma factor RsiW